MRDYLVAQGIVRVPSVPGTLPPLWLEPRLGTPAPGEGDDPTEQGPDVVIGAFLTGGISPQPFESFIRQDTVELRLRTTSAPGAFAVEAQIRAALVDQRGWVMAGMGVIDSEQWRPLQRLGSDNRAYDWSTAFIFQTYAVPV